MTDETARLIAPLLKSGWTSLPPTLPPTSSADAFLLRRFHGIPLELAAFLASYEALHNINQTRWFYAAKDYSSPLVGGFNWDDFESMSLDAAAGDATWTKNIQQFWARHLTIFAAVDGRYQYVAYCIAGEHRGKYVCGNEDDFEEVTEICDSLVQLCLWVSAGNPM